MDNDNEKATAQIATMKPIQATAMTLNAELPQQLQPSTITHRFGRRRNARQILPFAPGAVLVKPTRTAMSPGWSCTHSSTFSIKDCPQFCDPERQKDGPKTPPS
jgi:hypothetical protein